MFTHSLLLGAAFLFSGAPTAGAITLAWDANTETNIAGYVLYYGVGSRQYTQSTNVGKVTTGTVQSLTPGRTYYFAVTAYNTAGLESEPSNEVSYSVPTNGPFALVGLPAQVRVNKNTGSAIPFSIGGALHPSNLVLRVSSSNAKLLPTRVIRLEGSGTNRTLVLSPLRYKTGRTTVTLTATENAESTRFVMAVTVTGSNNPPTMAAVPALSCWKQATLAVPALQVRDVDAPAAHLRLTLSVSHGTLKALTTLAGGLTAGQVRGNGTSRLVITAPAGAINRTLARRGIVYRGNLNFVGADLLTAVLNDRGNVGTGGPRFCQLAAPLSVQGDAYDLWRTQNFAELDLRTAARQQSVWGDNADPDADGRDNLMEFALGTDPYGKQASTNRLFSSVMEVNTDRHLALTFARRPNQTIITYIPEVSADGLTWTSGVPAIEEVSAQTEGPSFQTVTCRDATPLSPGDVRLMRLRVVRATP